MMTGDWLTEDVVAAVARHMNDDHAGDTLTMVQPLRPNAESASVVGLDHHGLQLLVGLGGGATERLDLPWPGPLTQRADIRRFVVELHTSAAEQLGLPVDEHSEADHASPDHEEVVG